MSKATLTFFCGKMGSGKSTEAKAVAQQSNAVLLEEDDWLASLYPGKISSLQDYLIYSDLMKPLVKKLVQSILRAGTDVVMDFPANTVTQRAWFRHVFTEVGASYKLIYLDLPDEVCLRRVAKRRQERPERAATDTPEMFKQVNQHFMPPAAEEGFVVTLLIEH